MPYHGGEDGDWGDFDWSLGSEQSAESAAAEAASKGVGGYDLGVGYAYMDNKGNHVSVQGAEGGPVDSVTGLRGSETVSVTGPDQHTFTHGSLDKAYALQEGVLGLPGFNNVYFETQRAIVDKANRKGAVPDAGDFSWLSAALGMSATGAAQHATVGLWNMAQESGHGDPSKAVLEMIDAGKFDQPGDFAANYTAMMNERAQLANVAQLAAAVQALRDEQYKYQDDKDYLFYEADQELPYQFDTPNYRSEELANAYADLQSAVKSALGVDLESYENVHQAMMRGVSLPDLNKQQITELALGAIPGLNALIGGAHMFGAMVGQSIVGTFTENGIGYNLHEDGNISLQGPSDDYDEGYAPPYGDMSDLWRITPPMISGADFDRESALQNILQGLITEEGIGEFRPGLSPDQLNYILTSQLMAQNAALGEDATQVAFNEAFGGADLGRQLLLDEERQRQEGWRTQLGETFTGEAFAPDIDDEIINSIVQGRSREPRELVSTQEARGNLNPFGGRSANLFLSAEIPKATERVGEISSSLLGETQRDIDALRGTALSGITDFRLGDPLFDFEPATTQRQELIGGRLGSLRGDIETSLGSEPLFDVPGALSAGGRSQGVVSGGTTTNTLLDTLAQREMVGKGTERRGLGSRGTGAF